MATILLIEDQEIMRALIRLMLEDAGHQVTEAANGCEGLARYRACPVDLVITDITMPKMNGLELIAALTRESSNVRVIAMSGDYGKDANLEAAENLGARRTLHKPFSKEELLSSVRAGLAS